MIYKRRAATALFIVFVTVAGCSSSSRTAARSRSTHPSTTTATIPIAAETSARPEDRCDGITPEIEACFSRISTNLDRQRALLSAKVIAAAHQPDPAVVIADLKDELRRSEQAFVSYRDRACNAVFIASSEGTWRGIEERSCEIRLDRERIALLHEILDGKGIASG